MTLASSWNAQHLLPRYNSISYPSVAYAMTCGANLMSNSVLLEFVFLEQTGSNPPNPKRSKVWLALGNPNQKRQFGLHATLVPPPAAVPIGLIVELSYRSQ